VGPVSGPCRQSRDPENASRFGALVAHAIDQARQPDIVGTIAGDDTIFVAVGEANLAARIATWFRDPPAE
jgi:hypothetical protein